jgi:hypothetical protein
MVDGALVYRKHASADPRGKQPQSNLVTTTVRSFEGGLNVADTDLNMKPTYAKILDNIERGLDGALSVRHGTRLRARLQVGGDVSDIVNCVYFNQFIIAVQKSGLITKSDGAGVVTAMKIGTVVPWSNVTFCTFAIFNSDLIMCDGVHKPLIIAGKPTNPQYMLLEYLQDLGTLTNINTPIGSLCCTHGEYMIMAGIPAAPTSIYVSAKDTSGTWPGDTAPNDSIALDLGPRVSLGSATITGLVAYRDKLVVTFERGVLPVNLGVYTGSPSVHTPTDDGFIEEFGCLTHRSLISVGDDTFFTDNIGVNSIQRITLFNTLRPTRASQLIDPILTPLIQPLSAAQIQQYVFAVYDMRHFRYMLFVPVFDSGGNITETVGFSYTAISELKVHAWARLRGWVWQAGCRTALQNIIFANKNKLYSYAFDDDTSIADYVNDVDHNADGSGVAVNFDWELPWADFNKRMDTKATRYMAIDTQGSAEFRARAYADNLYMDKQTGADTPMLDANFVGGDGAGYGNVPYGNFPYGGGRRTSDERVYAWPLKFKLMKLRFSGSVKKPLKFVSISLAYLRGTIRR